MIFANKELYERSQDIVREELGIGMFKCDDPLDGCMEIVSDRIEEVYLKLMERGTK